MFFYFDIEFSFWKCSFHFPLVYTKCIWRGCRGRDRMVVGFYNYLCNQCLSPLMLWVRISIRARCTTLCDKVCQWLATGLWFSQGTPVSSTNKTDHHDIAEILLKVALNTIKQTNIYLDIFGPRHRNPYSKHWVLLGQDQIQVQGNERCICRCPAILPWWKNV